MSTRPSPPIIFETVQYSSTQANHSVETSNLSQQDNDKKSTKQSLLKKITVKRSASFGDQRKERAPKTDDKLLSQSSSSLKRDEMFNDQSEVVKRAKSFTQNTFVASTKYH